MTPAVRALLIATVGTFFFQITVPALADALVFVPRLVLVRPWSVVTYMFLHGGLAHLGFNMLGLFFFGPRVEERIGTRQFAIMYFLSGLTGALLSFLFSPGAAIVGASAGVFGVMLAFAYFWPHAPIHIWGVIPVPARVLVIVTTVIALFSGLAGAGRGIAHFAHLGGYAGAYLYLRWLGRSRTAFRRRATAAPVVLDRSAADLRAIDLTSVHELNRDEINRLLDKIGAEGVGSLTAQERLFLSNFVPPDDRAPPERS